MLQIWGLKKVYGKRKKKYITFTLLSILTIPNPVPNLNDYAEIQIWTQYCNFCYIFDTWKQKENVLAQ